MNSVRGELTSLAAKSEEAVAHHDLVIAANASRRQWWRNAALFPALLAAVLPKCPLCLMAYTGLLGAAGISPSLYQRWFLPLSIGFSAIALYMLARGARQRRGYSPLFLGFIAVAALLAGKFYFDHFLITYGGASLLLAAFLWNSWPKRKADAQAQCECH